MSKRLPFAPLAAAIGLGFSLIAGSLVAPTVAHAEGEIRIAEQFGIVYLLLNVVRDQGLIEKYGKQEGIDIKVDWTQLSGGAAVNDALLSGSIDIAGAGVGPLLTIWDRTHGKQNVKAVASLGNFPYYLVSNNPKVKTIADFTEKDRIAVPAVGVSVQSRFLQYAAAKQWGDKEFNRLDKYTIAVPHPDATAALIAGGTELTGHFSNPPFQDQALENPNVHVVLNSYDVLGPSGCGKSTLLKAVAGFIQPCEGEIRLQGQRVDAPGPDRIVVFQEFDQLPPWKTVKQNVMFPLLASRTLKKKEAEERALHYLEKVGLAAFADAYPHTLSGGMKARVAIARALAMQPKILLMDEPFAALDALTRRKMQEELLLLWEEVRFTLLFVTHSIEEALVVGNRILLLSPHPGRVRAEVHSHQYDLHSLGGVAFQESARRVHRLLFDEGQSPETERDHDFNDIRIAY